MPVKNTKVETAFPVRGARAGRLPEDDWSLDTEVLQAWAEMQRELEAAQLQAAAEPAASSTSSTASTARKDRAERRRQRWETIRAKAGEAAGGVG